MEWIVAQFRQIDIGAARIEQGFYPQGLLDDVIVRSKHRQRSFEALELFLDGVAARGTKRGTGICREHMLHKSTMHVAQVVGRLSKREAAAPSAEHVATFGCRPQRLLAVLFQLALLFF